MVKTADAYLYSGYRVDYLCNTKNPDIVKASEQTIVFVLDPNVVYQRVLSQYLKVAGIPSVITFSDPEKMLSSIKLHPDVLISEYLFSKNTLYGAQVLAKVRKHSPATDIYFHTSLRDVDAAVNAIQSGAVDYIIKRTSAADELVRKIVSRLQLRKTIKNTHKSFRKILGYLGMAITLLAALIFLYSRF